MIFVPGIGGSYLYVDGVEKWPAARNLAISSSDEHLFDLSMSPEGTFAKDVKVGDITRVVDLPFWPDSDIYDTTIKEPETSGYVEGKSLFPFPYDWREDVRTVKGGNEIKGEEPRSLLEFIDYVLAQTGSSQVDIMAHSQGGLAAFSALKDSRSAGKVRKVLTLGTPVLGATKALGILQYQMPCFADEIVGIYCPSSPETVQKTFENMPGAYQLLPSPAFDDAEGAPLVIDRDVNGDGKIEGEQEGPQRYNQWSKIVEQDRDQDRNMLGLAYDSHEQVFDKFTPAYPSVELSRVVGSGISTPERIREYSDCGVIPFVDCGMVEREVEYTDKDKLDIAGGDGTVPLHSADLSGSDQSGAHPSTLYTAKKVKHVPLAKDPGVLDYAIKYFGEGVNPASSPNTFGATAAEGPTLGSEPAPFGGIELETVGPVSGHVEDKAGNVLGEEPSLQKGAIAQEIANGLYTAISNTQSFFLNEDGSYTSKLEVTGKGGVRIRVRSYANSEMDGQAVFRVDAPEGSNLRLGFATGQNPNELRLGVDENGDGTTDKEVAPDSAVTGPTAGETDPPKTAPSLKVAGKGRTKVTLSAKDGSEGSGIANTYYKVEGESEARFYEKPFTVPSGTEVRFYSVDQAGNTEPVKETRADK